MLYVLQVNTQSQKTKAEEGGGEGADLIAGEGEGAKGDPVVIPK